MRTRSWTSTSARFSLAFVNGLLACVALLFVLPGAPLTVRLAGAAVGLALCAGLWRGCTMRLSAGPERVRSRGVWRTRSFRWDEVEDLELRQWHRTAFTMPYVLRPGRRPVTLLALMPSLGEEADMRAQLDEARALRPPVPRPRATRERARAGDPGALRPPGGRLRAPRAAAGGRGAAGGGAAARG